MAVYETYRPLMLKKRMGFPLWFPDISTTAPPEYLTKGIQIGDVGRITPKGSFQFLFNVTIQADDPIHVVHGVPAGYEPYEIRPTEKDIHPHMLPPMETIGMQRMRNVKMVADLKAESITVGAGASIKVERKTQEAAVLVVPNGASSEDLYSPSKFLQIAQRDASKWFEFLDEQGIDGDKLYLVTGCVKTSAWAIACLAENSSDTELSLSLNAMVEGTLSGSYGWSHSSPAATHVGPIPPVTTSNQCPFFSGYSILRRPRTMFAFARQRKIVVEDAAKNLGQPSKFTPKSSPASSPPASSSSSTSISTTRSTPSGQSRGTSSFVGLDHSMSLFAESESESELSGASESSDSWDFDIEYVGPESSPDIFPDLIQQYMLQKFPEAENAIVHDSQLYSIDSDTLMEHPLDLDSVLIDLQKNYTFSLSFGSIFLQPLDPIDTSGSVSLSAVDLVQVKPSEFHDPYRISSYSGELYRWDNTSKQSSWTKIQVVLFDNSLIYARPMRKSDVAQHVVPRNRIPLKVGNFDDPPVTASDLQPTLANIKNEDSYMEGSASDGQLMYPFIVFGIKFYAESQTIRMEWKSKLDGAVKLRNRLKESDSFIGIETLSSTGFTESPAQSTSATASSNQENPFTGTVTCSVPFTTSDDRALVAVGCAEGLWIGVSHDPTSMRRVLHLKHITQCAVLDDYGILLVLAHGSLLAYTIKSLVSSTISNAYVPDKVQKLNGNRPVEFFRVGCLGVTGHTFVIYMKKKGDQCSFRVLVPTINKINDKSKSPITLTSRLGIRGAVTNWFRTHLDFTFPSLAFDLVFLKTHIAILSPKGFELVNGLYIVSPNTLDRKGKKNTSIPLIQLLEHNEEKSRRHRGLSRPLAIIEMEKEYLLCYDEFGSYVDKIGVPTRGLETMISWTSKADRIAVHLPYMLVFNPNLIEVRHVESGHVIRIIPGNEIRCIWDGLSNANSSLNTAESNVAVGEPWFHAVMGGAKSPSGDWEAVSQRLFALTPTLPFYLPSISQPAAGLETVSESLSELLPSVAVDPSDTMQWKDSNLYSESIYGASSVFSDNDTNTMFSSDRDSDTSTLRPQHELDDEEFIIEPFGGGISQESISTTKEARRIPGSSKLRYSIGGDQTEDLSDEGNLKKPIVLKVIPSGPKTMRSSPTVVDKLSRLEARDEAQEGSPELEH